MIIDRILQVVEYKGISKSKFCQMVGFSNGFLDKVNVILTIRLRPYCKL
jgi:hypothetical protein